MKRAAADIWQARAARTSYLIKCRPADITVTIPENRHVLGRILKVEKDNTATVSLSHFTGDDVLAQDAYPVLPAKQCGPTLCLHIAD